MLILILIVSQNSYITGNINNHIEIMDKRRILVCFDGGCLGTKYYKENDV